MPTRPSSSIPSAYVRPGRSNIPFKNPFQSWSFSIVWSSWNVATMDLNWRELSIPDTLHWDDPSHASQQKILKDFSLNMRQSKVCVFDGSIEGKFIRKFAQAMLSGWVQSSQSTFCLCVFSERKTYAESCNRCVIASDLPADHDLVLKDNIIQLKLDSNIEVSNLSATNKSLFLRRILIHVDGRSITRKLTQLSKTPCSMRKSCSARLQPYFDMRDSILLLQESWISSSKSVNGKIFVLCVDLFANDSSSVFFGL